MAESCNVYFLSDVLLLLSLFVSVLFSDPLSAFTSVLVSALLEAGVDPFFP